MDVKQLLHSTFSGETEEVSDATEKLNSIDISEENLNIFISIITENEDPNISLSACIYIKSVILKIKNCEEGLPIKQFISSWLFQFINDAPDNILKTLFLIIWYIVDSTDDKQWILELIFSSEKPTSSALIFAAYVLKSFRYEKEKLNEVVTALIPHITSSMEEMSQKEIYLSYKILGYCIQTIIPDVFHEDASLLWHWMSSIPLIEVDDSQESKLCIKNAVKLVYTALGYPAFVPVEVVVPLLPWLIEISKKEINSSIDFFATQAIERALEKEYIFEAASELIGEFISGTIFSIYVLTEDDKRIAFESPDKYNQDNLLYDDTNISIRGLYAELIYSVSFKQQSFLESLTEFCKEEIQQVEDEASFVSIMQILTIIAPLVCEFDPEFIGELLTAVYPQCSSDEPFIRASCLAFISQVKIFDDISIPLQISLEHIEEEQEFVKYYSAFCFINILNQAPYELIESVKETIAPNFQIVFSCFIDQMSSITLTQTVSLIRPFIKIFGDIICSDIEPFLDQLKEVFFNSLTFEDYEVREEFIQIFQTLFSILREQNPESTPVFIEFGKIITEKIPQVDDLIASDLIDLIEIVVSTSPVYCEEFSRYIIYITNDDYESNNDHCNIDIIIKLIEKALVRQKKCGEVSEEFIKELFEYANKIEDMKYHCQVIGFILIALEGIEGGREYFEYAASLLSVEMDEFPAFLIDAMFIFDPNSTLQLLKPEVKSSLIEYASYPYFTAAALKFLHFLPDEELFQFALTMIRCFEEKGNELLINSNSEDINFINLEFDSLSNEVLFSSLAEFVAYLQSEKGEVYSEICSNTNFITEKLPSILSLLNPEEE